MLDGVCMEVVFLNCLEDDTTRQKCVCAYREENIRAHTNYCLFVEETM